MSENTMSTPAASAKGDDRNLVPVDPANTLSLEDQAFLIWKKQRTFIIGSLVVVAVALIGWFTFRGMQASREAGIRTAFGQATTIDAKRAFAREHPAHPLAGLALLAMADDHFANARYDEAGRDYADAGAVLTDPLLAGRARLGQGTAVLKSGQPTQGEQLLTRLAEDATALMAYRSQAWYILATHAAGTGDKARALTAIDKLRALDPEGDWASLATALRTRLDEDTPAAMPGASSLEVPAEPPPATPAP